MAELLQLAARVGGRWRPGIGDPSVMGWVTVAAYLLAAALCWRCAVSLRGQRLAPTDGKERRAWYLLAALLLLLGVNKQLDLQSWVTLVGKGLVKSEGWSKSLIQGSFIAAMLASGVVAAGLLFWWAWRLLRRLALALIGVVFLICFVTIRAVSLHPIDRLLGTYVWGAKLNWVLELGGIVCVALGGWQHLRRGGRNRPGSDQHCGRGR